MLVGIELQKLGFVVMKSILLLYYLLLANTREFLSMKLLHGIAVKFVNDSSESTPMYLLVYPKRNSTAYGVLRKIPSCLTAKRFGFDCQSFTVLPESSYTLYFVGEPLPPMEPRNQDPDEFMRLEMTNINAVQPNLVVKIDYLGEYVWHPSMVYFSNQVLLSARGPERVTFEIPHFHWLNITENQTIISSPIAIDTKGFNFIGKEQVRMVKMPNDMIHMSFTVPRSMFFARMQTAALRFNRTRQIFELTKPVWMHKLSPDVMEKNWVPFLYHSNIFFVYNVQPLVVIRFPSSALNIYESNFTVDEVHLEIVSEEKCHTNFKSHWLYGHLRGGSPAVFVNGEYLAFFHSKSPPLGGWGLASYWVGAYTFTAEAPFAITKMSKVPIIKPEWYDGAWFDKANGYIVYPAGFVIKEFDNISYVMLSFSLQDRHGYLAKIPLQALYDSMIAVNCSVFTPD